jgi:N-acyl-D-aspartate/D-glutamate deacylase
LLDVVSAWGRGAVEVTTGEAWTVDDLYELQPRVGVPFTYGALLSMPSGEHRRRLALHERGTHDGADVWPQVSPRPLTFTFRMDDPFPLNADVTFAELMSGDLEARRQAYADAQWRERAEKTVASMTMAKPRWETYEIAESHRFPELVGRELREIAACRGSSPFAALLDIAAVEPELRVRAVAANDDAAEVADLLRAQHCALGLSDAGAHVGQLCDAPQATDFLGRWVRDRQLMSLEEGVRRLTSAQADLFGFGDRGRLRPDAAADVVVFDPATIAPGPVVRVRDFPGGSERLTAPSPIGVRHVLVGGIPIRVDEEPLPRSGDGPGRVVAPDART